MVFKPGEVGNPAGRAAENVELKRRARAHIDKALNILVKALEDKNPQIRVQAAKELLDRGYGRAPQYIETKKVDVWDEFTADELRAMATGISPEDIKRNRALPEAGDIPTIQ
jgi:hypothetical protein